MSPAKPKKGTAARSEIALRIVALEGGLPDVEVTTPPHEVRIDKLVAWTKHETSTSDPPHLQFASADGRTMSIALLFDNSGAQTSVEPITARLSAMTEAMDMNSSEDKKRPPRVAFRWTGTTLPEMQGVIEALSIRFLEFAANGTPVKAEAAVRFREASRASFKRK